MLTLLINGWSCKARLDYLGMTVESSDTRHVRAYAKSAAAHAAAIALHDIVAKYGLDVHGAAQVEKSQLQKQATQRWNRVRRRRDWAWSKKRWPMIRVFMEATLGRG